MAQYIPCFGFIFILLCGTDQSETSTSKACFGTPGLPCTRHDLVCTRGSIAISEAYYTDNRDCGAALSSCHVNVANVKETRDHHKFNETEMGVLYSNCSSKTRCRYLAPRRTIISFRFKVFSVVKYKCNRGPESRNGPVIGAVVSSIIVATALALAVFFFLRRRRRRADKKGSTVSKKLPNQEESYALAGSVTENYYHEKQKANKIPDDYDYASADGLGNPMESGDIKVKDKSKHSDQDLECDYDHIGDTKSSQTGDYDTTASVAHDVRLKTKHVPEEKDVYSYDHLNGKPGTGNTSTGNNGLPQSTEYDTMTSTKKAVAKLDNKEKNLEGDYYDYNHLGSNQKTKTIQNEYDTTASAVKAVSDLETTTTAENDYDHF